MKHHSKRKKKRKKHKVTLLLERLGGEEEDPCVCVYIYPGGRVCHKVFGKKKEKKMEKTVNDGEPLLFDIYLFIYFPTSF